MARLYTLYMLHNTLPVYSPSPNQLSEFIEYLAKAIRAHLTAINRLHLQQGRKMTALKHFMVKSHLTASDKALALPVRQAAALQPEQMEHILRILAGRRHHEPFSFAFALAFTTFVRQSNLAPQSESSFNPAKHTQRKDMVQSKDGLFLAVFWTKTRQHSRTPDLIPLPLLKDSILCPVFHWIKYKDYSRGAPMQGPLLVTTAQAGAKAVFTTITLPFLRSVFANLVQEAGLTGQFTLHSLRRGGSQTCYRGGAAISDVMLQGTWTSGAVWDYLAKGISHNSSVMGACSGSPPDRFGYGEGPSKIGHRGQHTAMGRHRFNHTG